jgi:hypothetical protein
MMYVYYEYCYADGEWDIWVDDYYPVSQPRNYFCNESHWLVAILEDSP